MDDYEAEVDLAVNASILLKIPSNENQLADEDGGAESTEPTITFPSEIAEPFPVSNGERDVDNANEDAANLTVEDATINNPETEDEVHVNLVDSAIDNDYSAESSEAVEKVIDVSSASQSGISANENMNGSNTTQTESFECQGIVSGFTEQSISDEYAVGFTENNVSQSSNGNDERHKSFGNTIATTILTDEGEKRIQIKVIDATWKKPFLGGFRHKLTGVEYLNASCQTYAKKILPKNVEFVSRDTQTVQKRNQMQQTTSDTSTQMTKPGCYVTDKGDVIRVPGKYVSADEQQKIKLEKVIIIQSYWRRWLATQYIKRLKVDRDHRVKWEREESRRVATERAERLSQEFERRMQPKLKADFDLLYAALEKWRQEEVDRINNSHSGAERKAALIGLLEQEAYLIQSIERHRLNADKENYTENVTKFLDKAAQPKFWRAFDGKKTEMNTKHSLRAQELRDLYNSLQMKYLDQDERLDVLLTLKHTVMETECKLTHELTELIDREADLLTRGVKSFNLEGLRQRISTLFLQYCKTPLYNPDVARLLKVPQDPSNLRKDVYFCPSCNSYLPSREFPLSSNSRIVGRCKKCSKLDNNARLRHDFTKIRNILQHLRRTEEMHNDGSKIAFIIQDADLSYLIENIWNSQSALSGLEDLYDLVFVRWNKFEHWSPWNCVLLTKEEASAHMKLENIAEAYGRIFVGKVHHRHVIAKQYFSKLSKIAKDMAKANVKKSKMTQKIETVVAS